MFGSLLEEAIDAWTDAREGFVRELENIPDERFETSPFEDARSPADLARHILEVSLMMVGELTRADTNLKRHPWNEMMELYASEVHATSDREDLLRILDETLAGGSAKFRAVGEVHMLQTIERFDGVMGTRLAWFHHGIAHEMYHRGQLAFIARAMGIEPALTRRIRGG